MRKVSYPTAVIHGTYGDTAPSYNQIGFDRIKRLVEVAERKGVNLALENLRQPGALDYIFSKIQSDRLGFCYDSGHENCFTKGTDFLSQYGSKLMALHLHDNDGTDDQHWLPGEGGIDWPVLMKKLKKTGYSGPNALEVEGRSPVSGSDNNPKMYLQRAFQAGKRLAEYFKAL